MEDQAVPRTRLHPLVATAAVAVTIASAVGIAAITGLLPGSAARHAEPALVAQAPAVAPAPPPQQPAVAAPSEPAPVARTVAKAAPKPKPVVHHQAASVPPAPLPEPVQVAQAPAPGTYPPVPPDYRPAPAQAAAARPMCFDCGIVETMREVETKGEGTGLGAVAGGIGGLILGHQVGGGAGNKIATVLGAAGGAYAGHQLEKNARATKSYEVSVIMDDGSRRTVMLASAPTWRAGDHVRVVNGTLEPDNR